MSEIQVITVVVGVIGFVATVLNLVAFVREKDRGHLKVGLRVLALMALGLAVLFMPRLAPGGAQTLADHLPAPALRLLGPWLTPKASPTPTAADTAAAPLQGSFTVELKRNLLGGVDSLMAHFEFANLSPENARVTAFRVRYRDASGQTTHSFYRVLPTAISLDGQGHAAQEVELDPEIRDVWVAGLGREEQDRDRMEITWEGHDSQGRRFGFSSGD